MFSTRAAGLVKHQTHVADDAKDRFYNAMDAGDTVTLEEILKNKDKLELVNAPFPKGNLPLNVACVHGYDPVVKLLLSKVFYNT